MVDRQIDAIETHWNGVSDDGGLTHVQRQAFCRRQVLNPFASLDSQT